MTKFAQSSQESLKSVPDTSRTRKPVINYPPALLIEGGLIAVAPLWLPPVIGPTDAPVSLLRPSLGPSFGQFHGTVGPTPLVTACTAARLRKLSKLRVFMTLFGFPLGLGPPFGSQLRPPTGTLIGAFFFTFSLAPAEEIKAGKTARKMF